MSTLTDRITTEHREPQSYMDPYCSCGQVWTGAHIAQITEAAVREKLAADIAALEHTYQQLRDRVNQGFGVEWPEGYDAAVWDAVELVQPEGHRDD